MGTPASGSLQAVHRFRHRWGSRSRQVKLLFGWASQRRSCSWRSKFPKCPHPGAYVPRRGIAVGSDSYLVLILDRTAGAAVPGHRGELASGSRILVKATTSPQQWDGAGPTAPAGAGVDVE